MGHGLVDTEAFRELVKAAVREVLDERQFQIESDLLSKDQVAKLLGITTRTVTTYCAREGMPHKKRMGRLEFRRDEVLAWWRDKGHSVPTLKAV